MQANSDTQSDSPQLQTLSRQAFWLHHVTQWRDSGLSKAAYCKKYSLVYHQMVYWCTKSLASTSSELKSSPSNFIPVSVLPTPVVSSTVTVRLPNGVAIEGIDELSIALVGKLIEQL